MERRMTLTLGLCILLLVGVALGDSIPAGCPRCYLSPTIRAYYQCPDYPSHDFTVYPAWRQSPGVFPPAVDWHCPYCNAYPCYSYYCECTAPGCGWHYPDERRQASLEACGGRADCAVYWRLRTDDAESPY